ncbi:hypothetical protein CEXT_5481 [Caerostris extrusa]|uniref:Uncharacterized protein n=1 Tax=Caerostris extrusa TaxID=172846 RepID=A0AAV4XI10_CAEEX|nr:hypothetical protein CEXT_5481 [Caerostris extrusa]
MSPVLFEHRIFLTCRRRTTFLASTAGIISVTCDGQTRRWNGANRKRDSFAHKAREEPEDSEINSKIYSSKLGKRELVQQ